MEAPVTLEEMNAAIDANLLDRPIKAKPGRDNANRPNDRSTIGIDFVSAGSNPIPPACRDILAKSQNRHISLPGKVPYSLADQCRLHRRAAGRIDD